ncbi:MAG: glycosyltransferase family 1 protein [Chloroflexota bacterium]
MILGIDASRAASRQRTGTEAYAYFLIRALIPLAAEGDHQVRLYFNQPPTSDLFPRMAHVDSIVIPRDRLWTHTRLRQELIKGPPDIFFTPAHVIPIGYRGPSVATIHDLGYEYFPEAHPRRQLAYLRWSTRHNARAGHRVIADSKATQVDLARYYKVDPDKVNVIYPGIDPDIRRIEDDRQTTFVLEKYDIRTPYLLYVGTLQPRKNLVRLIEAFAQTGLYRRGISLVLVGKVGWLAQPILDAIGELPANIREHIKLTGYIGETEKNLLLSGAKAMVFPSLYEGFGFPVLEAQACGTPVICSNTSSLPEVAGEGAILVDPLNTDALAHAMRAIVDDEPQRLEMVKRGFANLQRFDWRVTASRVLAVLESVMNQVVDPNPP